MSKINNTLEETYYMKNFVLLLIVFLMYLNVNSQEKYPGIYDQIVLQIWTPFKKSFDTKDANTFNSLHTDSVLRINSWGIKQGADYKNDIIKSYGRTSKKTRTIEFWIEQSVLSETIAHQIGYYAVTYKQPNMKDRKTYAQFQVTLKKINGIWKISQDFDTGTVAGVKVDATFIKQLKKLKL